MSLHCYAQNSDSQVDTIELTAVQKFAKYFEFSEGKNWVYIPVPNVAYSPETSLSFGMANQILYRKKGDTTSTASSVNFSGFYTIKKQYLAVVDWTGYFADDELIIRAYIDHSDFPLNFYGIGRETDNEPEATYHGKSLVFSSQASFQISDALWMGPTVDLQIAFTNKFTDAEDFDPAELVGEDGFFNVGAGVLLQFDKRDHRLYSKEGLYLGLSGSIYPTFLGSTTNNFAFEIDYRHFVSPGKGSHTLGWQAKVNAHFGEVPFQILSSVGGSKYLRGYYRGRYRDAHSAIMQFEYRFPLLDKIGLRGAAFMGAGDVFTNPAEVELKDLKATIGGGLRYMLDNKTRTTVRFDYARSRNGDNGFYIEVLEAF